MSENLLPVIDFWTKFCVCMCIENKISEKETGKKTAMVSSIN